MPSFSMLNIQTQPANFQMGGHHFHDEFEIYYLVAGQRSYLIKDRIISVKEGGLVFINSHVLHKTMQSGTLPHTRILMNFKPGYLKRWQPVLPGTDFSPLFERSFFYLEFEGPERSRYESVFQAILDTRDSDMAELKTTELLMLLIKSLAKGSGVDEIRPASTKLQRVEKITQYIAKKEAQVTLDELCAQFYLSRFYLCRLFKEASGMTITEYINSVRVIKAQAMLQASPKSITEIAQEAGFESLGQFERVFKTMMGTTARAYRIRSRAINEESAPI